MREPYRVEFERNAQRALRRLPDATAGSLERPVDELEHEPRPRGALKLSGRVDSYRLRVGEYRIVYAVFDRERLVKVLDIMRRTGQTYRK